MITQKSDLGFVLASLFLLCLRGKFKALVFSDSYILTDFFHFNVSFCQVVVILGVKACFLTYKWRRDLIATQ